MTDEKVLAALARAMDKAAADFSSYDWDWFQDERVAPAILAALHDAGWTLVRQEGLDAAYRERNAVVAALIRTNGWPAVLTPAPDAEGWWIVYAETPQGQVSWHVSPTDIRLFDHVPAGYAKWDGHTTDEKYERVAALARVLRGDDQ